MENFFFQILKLQFFKIIVALGINVSVGGGRHLY